MTYILVWFGANYLISLLSFLTRKMGMMMLVSHSVVVKIKWEKNIKELNTGMAQSIFQFELSLKKNKLDLFVLILQTRSWGSSEIWTGEMSPVPIVGTLLLHTFYQGTRTRSKAVQGPGPLEGSTRFLSCLQQPQQVWFRFSKKFLLPRLDPGKSRPVFLLCWIEIDVAQVLFGFLWICCRIKAHV